jgi:hypothetical protein
MSTQLSKRQQQRNEQILQGLIKYRRFCHEYLFYREQGNNKCADCGAPNPSWASYNIGISFFRKTNTDIVLAGIFLCVRCAIIHRKIGTHITKIKSLTLDKWTPEQIAVPTHPGRGSELTFPP